MKVAFSQISTPNLCWKFSLWLMIFLQGLFGLPESGATFFQAIMEATGTTITWPSKLKIGAKSKKDPHIKVTGMYYEIGDRPLLFPSASSPTSSFCSSPLPSLPGESEFLERP